MLRPDIGRRVLSGRARSGDLNDREQGIRAVTLQADLSRSVRYSGVGEYAAAAELIQSANRFRCARKVGRLLLYH